MVEPRIMRSLLRRKAIWSRERLCVTLRYLASGDSRGTIAASYRVSAVTVSRIINETCLEILNSLLQEGYIAPPETPDDWKKIADDYYRIWNFPNCVGSINRKHTVTQAPMRSSFSYFTYKSTHSIALIAV